MQKVLESGVESIFVSGNYVALSASEIPIDAIDGCFSTVGLCQEPGGEASRQEARPGGEARENHRGGQSFDPV